MDDLRDTIVRVFNELWSEDHDTAPPELTDDIVLLESGLDSMGFAVLVTMLDMELGYDPFSIDEVAVYPRTFAEFVAFYESHRPDE